MVRLRPAAAVVIVLALIAPASALAQTGASDNQYADPFASTPASGGHKAPGHHPSAPAPSTPAPTGAPAPRASAPAAPAAPAASAGSSNPASRSTASSSTAAVPSTARPLTVLPFTGFDTLEEAIAGALLLLGGAALRLRVRRREVSRAVRDAAGA